MPRRWRNSRSNGLPTGKLIEGNCLAHHEVSDILQQTLNEVFKSPFCFLDIASSEPIS
jgi:hypothetical protein